MFRDIKNIETYNPAEVNDKSLLDDWRIVHAWWGQLAQGREFTFSREQVINVATLIYEEMKKRDFEFHPEKYSKASKELFEIVSRGKVEADEPTECELLTAGETPHDHTARLNRQGTGTSSRDKGHRHDIVNKVVQPAGSDNHIHKLVCDGETDVTNRRGIILVEPHGQLTVDGKKTVIVKSKPFDVADEKLVVVQEDEALGTVTLAPPEKIDLKTFESLKDDHKITEEERLAWWPDYKTLYSFKVKDVVKFPKSREIQRERGTQTFIENVKYTEGDQERDLAVINPSGENFGEVIRLDEILPYFKDFYTSKPFIYLVGGLCNHPKKGTRGDIDILIREQKPRGNERMPLLFRIYRMFPKELWHRIQILWSDDDFGPFTNYIPLYNNLLERSPDKDIILMSKDDYIQNTGDYQEFRVDSEIQFEQTDVLRTSKEEIKKAAAESKKRGIKPFRFFEMLKGIAGYRKQEIYSVEGLKDVLKPQDYPYEVDEKYDGMRVQIHKRGDSVKILSIDGKNHTKKLKDMVEEILEWDHDLVLDAEITGWTKGYRKGDHLGRSDVAGFIHAREPIPKDVHLFANIFDILYRDGKDLHTLPLADRRALLEKLSNKDNLKIIPMRVAKNWTEMKKAVAWASKFPGSEGAMIKSFMSAYPLGGQTAKWIKFKKEADLDAEVVAVHKVKGTEAWNYLSVIRSSRGDAIPVGRTYNTKIKAKVGDIIRVAFVNLNQYTDPKTDQVWFNWWAPRVIEKREDKKKPDNDLTALRIFEQTDGEFGEKPFPKRYKEVLKVDDINFFLEDYPDVALEDVTAIFDLSTDEFAELYRLAPPTFQNTASVNDVFDANPYLTPADEDKKWRFVLDNHFRGKSLHGDIRLERPSFLVGWTLNYQKAGKPSKDIDTMKEALAFSKNLKNIKNFQQGTNGAQQIVSEKKAPQPLSWLKFESVTEPGAVGATKEHEGVVDIAASGDVEFGTQKPYYHEYFVQSKKGPYKDIFNGRLVVRLLKNIWGEKAGRGKFVWMAWLTKDPRPYILSKRAVDIKVMPPQGLSWLPRAMRKKVPKQYRYWTMKGKKAREARDELSKLYRKGDITLDQTTADIPDSGKFSLTEICWRGPIVIRGGCSRTENHIFLHKEGARASDIYLDGSPIKFSKVAAALGEPKDKKWMNFEGKLPNESVLNPDKETPAVQKQLASGTYKVIKRDGDLITFDFRSKDFSGKYVLMRTRPKTSLWVFKKAP